ncbi:hypothetical protein TEA_000893 [Camellia sinensis var. sinensis]|uniref:AAA+ ATPase domain-containing protein n=1 Tax=Camellia sinensis var. sinensis TaxID=542762 RepID=A0A4S4ENJ9_CAMSN|nr:hypothetical protein TEA_000893 [Camellia sinensis var. sinensis]
MSALQGVFSIVGAIAGRIVEPVIQLVVLHVGFVFQYKKKQKKLEVEIKNLEEHKKQIEEKVDEAITRGEEVDEPVSNWLAEVEERVQKIKEDNTIDENMQCFKFSCPDYISHYRISKDAENKMEEVKNLSQSGNFSTVAHPKPFAQELQFPSSSANYANFESRELAFNNIMVALQDSNVKMIGIYGTGGVGKTTIVEEIGKQVKNGLFNEVVVAVVSQDAYVSNIQGQLADRLNLELKGETEVGKANQLWNRLNNGKKNLIILDDMWQELDLKTIGIPITDGNNCCKVVITSRIRGVLEKMHVNSYVPMQVLLEKEAWSLFKMKVGNSVDSVELHDIANAVCKECGGLPVAILAVGAALKDKKKYVWEDVLDQFKDSMLKNIAGIDPKVYASLKLSYDRLESSDAKSCFLICCFFPEDTNISIEVLARHCIARSLLGQNTNTLKRASRRVLTVVDILKDACLLLEGKDENFVKVHDVIRDVALSIAKDDGKEILVKHGEKKWPEKDTCESSSAMSLRFDNTLELPDDLVCPQLHTLAMKLKRNINPLLNVPDRFFSGMEKLTILELNRICMLPPLSLANLVNLRMLWLDNCVLGDIAILKDLNNNLEILSLQGSNIEVLPSEIGQLTRLRLLDLGNCKKLTEIPQGVISNLSRLEELYILDDYEFGHREERSKVNLDELKYLFSLSCARGFPRLQRLGIFNCEMMEAIVGIEEEKDEDELSSQVINFSQLKYLCLGNLPKLISFYPKVEKMSTSEGSSSTQAQFLFNEKVAFPVLEYLNIQKLPNIIEIWDKQLLMASEKESKSFCQLEAMTVSNCEKLVHVVQFNMLPRLQNLNIFEVDNCPKVEAIVSEKEKEEGTTNNDIIVFSQLTTLHLYDLVSLKSFYNWPTRSEAQPLFNHQASKICLKFLDVANLNKLIVRNCSEVAEVFQLEGLNVGERQHVRPLIEVRMMELDALPQLTCLWNKDPHGILGLQILQYLTIKKCSLLRNLFTCSTAMALQQLKVLYLESCPVMEEVIAAAEDGLKEVIDDVIEFPKLEWLILKDLPNLNSFCNAKYNFNLPSLQRVVLKRCPNMHNFTFGQVRMSQIFVSTHGNDGLQIEDLNKYLKERLLLKGEECATVDENDHRCDEVQFSYLKRL